MAQTALGTQELDVSEKGFDVITIANAPGLDGMHKLQRVGDVRFLQQTAAGVELESTVLRILEVDAT